MKKNITLFLLGCIPLRLLYAYFASKATTEQLKLLAIPSLAIAISFFYLFIYDLRKEAGETFGDKMWWNDLRPLHGGLFLAFAVMAMKGNSNSYIPLLLDAIIGLGAFTYYHMYLEN